MHIGDSGNNFPAQCRGRYPCGSAQRSLRRSSCAGVSRPLSSLVSGCLVCVVASCPVSPLTCQAPPEEKQKGEKQNRTKFDELKTLFTAIPTHFKITQQILKHWQPFRDLKLQFVGSRRQEQLSSRCQQRVVATVEESVLRMEMTGLESQEEDASQRVLFYKPMAWLGQIRPHRRDASWSAGL
jgi:hypothetical protein